MSSDELPTELSTSVDKLSTLDLEDYNNQLAINNQKMEGLLRAMFPDMEIPYEDIYQILLFLEETKVNAQIVPKVIRGIHNIVIGTGKGQVIVHVQGELMNVSMREETEGIKTKV